MWVAVGRAVSRQGWIASAGSAYRLVWITYVLLGCRGDDVVRVLSDPFRVSCPDGYLRRSESWSASGGRYRCAPVERICLEAVDCYVLHRFLDGFL